ncbi:MAG: hypothetical protein IPF66_10405 [Holophagales bacterium]|nr:hypothetical protein [Holophagales bacterium]
MAGRGARMRALSTALLGILLAIGPATPVFGLFLGVVPFASSIRYPEKYAILFGFGVVWLASLGAASLERQLGGKDVPSLSRLALLLVLDRAAITARLIPMSPASLLEERPGVLAALPVPSGGESPPRVFPLAMYRAARRNAPNDPRETGAWATRWALPFSASRWGAVTVFERDYDVSLPRPQLEWVLFVEGSPDGSFVLAALARAAGAVGAVMGEPGPAGRDRSGVPLLPGSGPAVPVRRQGRPWKRRAGARPPFPPRGRPGEAAFVAGPERTSCRRGPGSSGSRTARRGWSWRWRSPAPAPPTSSSAGPSPRPGTRSWTGGGRRRRRELRLLRGSPFPEAVTSSDCAHLEDG